VDNKPKVFVLEVVTPDRMVFKGGADSLVVDAVKGSMGVLPEHAPLLAALKKGRIKFRHEGRDYSFASSEGFIQVMPDRVRVLVETAKE
jgi:F-type H+-transporting ATPase subunit epsilon